MAAYANVSDEPYEIDQRLLGIGLLPAEMALVGCVPVVLDPRAYAQLYGLGISGDAITGGSPFSALHVEPVVFAGNRFEFAHDLRDATGHVLAVIIPVLNPLGETEDLVAWIVETGATASWRSAVSILGFQRLDDDHDDDDEGVRVFPSPAEWLAAGRAGIVILNPTRAKWELAGATLIVPTTAFGARLAAMLRLPPPRILVEVAA